MRRKIIFVDIDGPLAWGTWRDGRISLDEGREAFTIPYPWIEEDCQALQKICDETNAELVVSSDWKKYYSIVQLRTIFQHYNIYSPVIDTTRVGIISVENIINNLPLSNSGIVLSNGGSSYANSTDVTVTISGGGGSGATAVANVVGGVIDAVYVTNPGSGYTTSPTFTVTPGSGGGSGAVVTFNGEDKKFGGNSNVRYMTRSVTLSDGFDSGDLRVYLTAYRPSGANILVYYKILSQSDPDSFDDKNYQLMTQLGNENFVSTNFNDYRELKFAPGTSGVADNSISYTSGSTAYRSFRTFAIKIVLAGTSTVDVPKVRDLRVIALPEGN